MVQGTSWGLWYEPHLGTGIGDPTFDSICNKEIQYDTVIVHTVPEYYPRWRHLEKGKRLWGYTTWECESLPEHWPDLLNQMDGILVPSRWNQEVFVGSGVKVPVRVVPHIAITPSPPGLLYLPGILDQDFLFYTVSVWSKRKNIERLIHAFLDTFSRTEPVALLIQTPATLPFPSQNRFISYLRSFCPRTTSRELGRILRRYREPARIFLLNAPLTDDEMSYLHQRGDCYVGIPFGEGWGLGAFDAAAHGTPVIMPNYGGPRDYLSPSSAYLVEVERAKVGKNGDGRSYASNLVWAAPKEGAARQRMREVYSNRPACRTRGCLLKHQVETTYASQRVVKSLLSTLG